MRKLACVLLLVSILLPWLTGCGSGSPTPPPPTQQNPAPTVSSLSPASAMQGSAAFTLTVNGSGFVSSSVVNWNGNARPTTYVSSTQVTAAIPASDLGAAAMASVTVVNPSPGGGTSGAQSFTIAAVATISSIAVAPAPANATVGSALHFTAIATYTDHSTKDVTATATWQSDNAAIAAVDGATPGRVSALSKGSATITATQGGKIGTASVSVVLKTVYLVKDINTVDTGSSYPSDFARLGQSIFFAASDPVNGRELWKSDGTEAGTAMLKDICAGVCNSNPQWLIENNGWLYFAACDGTQLWKSDGTAAGTAMVKDLQQDAGTSFVVSASSGFKKAGTRLFFVSYGPAGYQLWTSDGTGAGTTMVKSLGIASDLAGMAAIGTKVAFVAKDVSYRWQVWVSDGTSAGTAAITSVSNDLHMVGVAGTSIFYAVASGYESWDLWMSDGTGPGILLQSFTGQDPQSLAVLNGEVLIGAAPHAGTGSYLWTTDGTPQGTSLLKTLSTSSAAFPAKFTAANNNMYFAAVSGVWKTDGTASGTVLVKDVWPDSLFSVSGKLLIVAYANGTPTLYASDGTDAGTVALTNVSITYSLGVPAALVDNGVLYFGGSTGPLVLGGPSGNTELWRSDGTAAGTYMLKNINQGVNGSSTPNNLTDVNGTLFFGATDGLNATELWKSDGTESGTVRVKAFDSTLTGIFAFAPAGETMFFNASATTGPVLWTTDGTEAGTIQLAENGYPPVKVGHISFFMGGGYNSAAGWELWTTDGTPAGTAMAKDICPGTCDSIPRAFVNVNGTAFFIADDGVHGTELWKSDGSANGTAMVADIAAGSTSSRPDWLTPVGGTLYFTADDGVHGPELWKSDGTAAGTAMVRNTGPAGAPHHSPTALLDAGGTLFFSDDDGTHGMELWKSDGTDAGTVMVKDIVPAGYTGSFPRPLFTLNGKLLFEVTSPCGTGCFGYWQSDGTEAGTTYLQFAEDWRDPLVAAGNKLYYLVYDPAEQLWQVWMTDGRSAGVEAAELPPGAVAAGFTRSGHSLYFTMNDATHGMELWAIDLSK